MLRVLKNVFICGLLSSSLILFCACGEKINNNSGNTNTPSEIESPSSPQEQTPATPETPETPEMPETPGDDSQEGNQNPSGGEQTPTPQQPGGQTPGTQQPGEEGEQGNQPQIDYDNLTRADITEEMQKQIVANVLTSFETTIQFDIGKGNTINKVIALDFESQQINLLFNYKSNRWGDVFALIKYPTTTSISWSSLYKNDIALNQSHGTKLVEYPATSNDSRGQDILTKFGYTESYDFIQLSNNPGPIIQNMGGTNQITVNALNSQGITKLTVNARSDAGYTDDPIGKGLLNGEEGKTYTTPVVEEFMFSENALYNFDGLQ